MMRLLDSSRKELDVIDAGTTMRFLLAYCALTNQHKILTGTPRMCERPIGILVDALREIGAEIDYLEKDGFPPLETIRFSHQKKHEISMRGDISSQYISAIMMVAPTLPNGLTIILKGKVASKPYILMTMELMKQFGAGATFEEGYKIIIKPSKYQPKSFYVESDWSGASYWFGIIALAQKAEILLSGLKSDSLQGDYKIMEIMQFLGVKSEFTPNGLLLTKQDSEPKFSYNFSNCPDLAQTVAVVCAAKGIPAEFTGLESLRIKETDRILALQNELAKIGATLQENGPKWTLIPAMNLKSKKNKISIETYDDHRMAMAFAPLASLMNIEIRNPSVVDKSYPSFWNHMELAGFVMEVASH
jgi:3-phosphoshikimate 1-carboxyvinyltransferase